MGDTESPEAAANKALRQKLLRLPDTDAGNAEAFELLHGRQFRFDRTKGLWLMWNNCYWAADERGEVERAALLTARARRYTAALIEGHKEAEQRIRWALRSEGVWGLEAMLKSARSIESLATVTTDYDQDSFLLTVANGTLELLTGELRPAHPGDLITRATNVPYDPAAKAARWMQFLDEVFAGDMELIGYIQRAVGYSLTGDTREQCFFMLCGTGANGKTTFLETVMKLPGAHAVTAPFSAFLVHWNVGGPRNDLAGLHGARFVKAAEAEQRARLDEAVMKQLTGGDTISARFLYHEPFTFKPQFKIWLATNHKPDIWETTEAIWRRIKLIEFNEQFIGSRMDPMLREKLEAELPGILAWAVQGCRDWLKHGLGEPQRVTGATQKYRQESDQVGRFLNDRCVRGPGHRTRAQELYDAYLQWCAQNAERPVANNVFARQLAERGITKKRGSGGWTYQGVGLVPVAAPGSPAPLPPKGKDT